MNRQLRLLGAALLAAGAASVSAQDTDCLQSPPILGGDGKPTAVGGTAGEVRFLSGGIGSDEAEAMRAQRKNYPLALTFAEHTGGRDAFVAQVEARVRKPDGTSVLCVITRGPYLFLDLPAGRYQIVANIENRKELVRTVNVVAGKHVDVGMVWPEAPSAAPPKPVAAPRGSMRIVLPVPAKPTAETPLPAEPAAAPEPSPAAPIEPAPAPPVEPESAPAEPAAPSTGNPADDLPPLPPETPTEP